MDDFIKLTGLPTFTFWVKDHKFEVAARNQSDAMSIANTELWGLMAKANADAKPGKFCEWHDCQHFPRTFLWYAA